MRCRATVNTGLGAHNTAISLEWYSNVKRVGAIHLSQLCAGSGRSEFQPNQDIRKTVVEQLIDGQGRTALMRVGPF